MKKLLCLLIACVVYLPDMLHAQTSGNGNPFAHMGYKASVGTFSDRQEFHDQTSVVEIGSVLLDTRTRKVIGFVQDRDSLVELPPEIISTSIDPLCEKYYSISPYVYVMNNPIKYIDPDGRSTWVLQNSDGTYRVVGGDLDDNDYNIYIYSIQNGQFVRGESIGVTTSLTSFYNDDDDLEVDNAPRWTGIINSNDKSGEDYLNSIFGNPPTLDEYMTNAVNYAKYDFKATGGKEGGRYNRGQYYRGMPIGKKDGKTVYTSARDVGNIAAGYVAAADGMSWKASRAAFDLYQSISKGNLQMESLSSRNAQAFGWKLGYGNTTPPQKAKNLKNSISSAFRKLFGRD